MNFESVCNYYESELLQLFDLIDKHNLSMEYVVSYIESLANLCDERTPSGVQDMISYIAKKVSNNPNAIFPNCDDCEDINICRYIKQKSRQKNILK